MRISDCSSDVCSSDLQDLLLERFLSALLLVKITPAEWILKPQAEHPRSWRRALTKTAPSADRLSSASTEEYCEVIQMMTRQRTRESSASGYQPLVSSAA